MSCFDKTPHILIMSQARVSLYIRYSFYVLIYKPNKFYLKQMGCAREKHVSEHAQKAQIKIQSLIRAVALHWHSL